MNLPSKYGTMGVSECDFLFCLYVVDGVGRMLGSFNRRYVVFMGVLLSITSILICDVSLWGALCGLAFSLKISAKFLMACNMAALIYATVYVGDGLYMASIRYNASLVSYS